MSREIEQPRTRLEAAERERDVGQRALDDAREREHAVVELLEVITRPSTDLQHVLDTIVSLAMQLTGARVASVTRLRDDRLEILSIIDTERGERGRISHESPVLHSTLAEKVRHRVARKALHFHGGPEAVPKSFAQTLKDMIREGCQLGVGGTAFCP